MLYFLFFLFLIPFLISLVSIPFFIKAARKKKLFDIPNDDILKIHKKAKPFLGGAAMVFAAVVGFLMVCIFQNNFYKEVGGIIFGCLVIFLLGFQDDLKWKHISKIKPRRKFFFLIILSLFTSVFLVVSGIKINFFPQIYFTVFLIWLYIFVFINAVNYQDGIDGLAGGLTAISLVGFIILSILSGNIFSLFLCLVLLGTVLGFLVFNFPPAKIFMGDSGAYFLGFILVVLASFYSKYYNILSLIGPVFVVGIPIFDGVFTNIRRILAQKSIFLGDRSHFYDKLLQKGFSVKKTLLISYSLQVLFVIIGVIISVLSL